MSFVNLVNKVDFIKDFVEINLYYLVKLRVFVCFFYLGFLVCVYI